MIANRYNKIYHETWHHLKKKAITIRCLRYLKVFEMKFFNVCMQTG